MPFTGFYADDPVDGTDVAPDRLGRQAYAAHLVTLLDRISTQSDSCVLALIGPWGGGKSSVLEMTLQRLRSRKEWRVAEFNPWAYSDLDAMLLGFFAEISAALPPDGQPAEIRKRIGRFVERISPIGAVGGVVGVDAQDALGQLGRWVAGDVSPTAERRKLVEALRSANQPIFMVLDDLDRLAPDELLLVFKLVRFVGRLPHVYYLLSYDERTLLDVLARTDLCGQNEARARDYLEKIVQVRLDLPPLRQAQAAKLLWNGIEELIVSLPITNTENGKDRFSRAYDACLRERLTTPRAINRYLAQVGALYSVLAEEVDFYDFALLTFIRTFEPALYTALYRMRMELSVDQAQPPWFGDDSDHMRRWRDLMAVAGVPGDQAEGLIAVLAELFLPVAAARSDGGYGSSAVGALADRKGVGHRDYFDRYFSFGVPDDDFPDAWLQETLSALDTADQTDSDLRQLGIRLVVDTDRTIRKISMRRPHEPRVNMAILVVFAENFSELSDVAAEGPSQRQIVERLAEVLVAEYPSELHKVLRRIAVSPGGVLLSTRLLASNLIQVDQEAIAENSRRVIEICTQHADRPFLDAPEDIKQLIHVWQMVDRDACRDWLRAQVESGRWDALDIAGWTIRSTLKDGNPVLTYFEDEKVDNLLGLSYLLERFARQLDTFDSQPPDLADTPDGRRLATLYSLRQLRERQST